MATMVTGIFQDEDHVEKAVSALMEANDAAEDLSIVVARDEERHAVPVLFKTAAVPAGLTGLAAGAVVGGLGAILLNTGVLAGPVALFAAGPVRALLQGLASGAVLGGGVGFLGGLGKWHEEVDLSEEDLRNGRVLVGVHTHGDNVAKLQQLLNGVGAVRITVCDTHDVACEQATV